MIEAAAICLGVGFLFSYSSHGQKMDAELLARATRVRKLKGLEEFLEKNPSNYTVVVSGIVGSNSPLLESKYGGVLGVFVCETATLSVKRMNIEASKEVYRKDVPWYLEDDSARVNVRVYQSAKGFYDILDKYIFPERVSKHFESFLKKKEIKIPDNEDCCKCCEKVLEIGIPLTVVGKAERDKDGAPTIGRVYQVFKGHVNVKALVLDLESDSVFCGKVSFFLTAVGMVLLVASKFQGGEDIKE